MGKGGGKAHTPREAKDNLKSTQLLSVIDAISEGPIEGPVDGLKSVLLNSTPVLDSERGHTASSAASDCRSHRRQRGIPGAGALGYAEGGEGCELYASPDRGSG
ncbi:putative phage tail component [Escherichia coli]|nr:putative phage tail component [Escherichia coli]